MNITVEGCAALDEPKLNASMRRFLNDPDKRKLKTWEFALAFREEFGLDPEAAGALLAEWSRELWARL